jgi:hypothetical protein
LSAIFCAVPAISRWDPAIGSEAGIEPDREIRLAQQWCAAVVCDADRQRAQRFRLAQAGKGERRRAAGGDSHHDILGVDIVLADEVNGLIDLILRALDRLGERRLAARHEQDQAFARPAEGRHQLGTVLHGQTTGGTGPDIDQAPAVSESGFHRLRGLFERDACGADRATAPNCPSIMASSASAGSHESISA